MAYLARFEVDVEQTAAPQSPYAHQLQHLYAVIQLLLAVVVKAFSHAFMHARLHLAVLQHQFVLQHLSVHLPQFAVSQLQHAADALAFSLASRHARLLPAAVHQLLAAANQHQFVLQLLFVHQHLYVHQHQAAAKQHLSLAADAALQLQAADADLLPLLFRVPLDAQTVAPPSTLAKSKAPTQLQLHLQLQRLQKHLQLQLPLAMRSQLLNCRLTLQELSSQQKRPKCLSHFGFFME